MQTRRIDFNSLPWETLAPGARVKIHSEAKRQVRLLELSRGFAEREWCTRGHIGYVLEGRVTIDFDGRHEVYRAGDGVFIPAGARHKAAALTDTVTLVLVEDVAEPDVPADAGA
jgi:quercetin dioxygenase-like cupin family protein